jgi:hypothetical protein
MPPSESYRDSSIVHERLISKSKKERELCAEEFMAGERILVVDDDQGLLTLMKVRLRPQAIKRLWRKGQNRRCPRAGKPL